ncbi:MAG: helix-turn-helix transcriptional regulator [Pirellulales bacterium]
MMHRDEQSLDEADDLLRVVRLLDGVTDPTLELSTADRKRRFVENLARLVDADVYIWSTTVVNHAVPGDFMTTCVVDGGWSSPEEQGRVYQVLTSVEFGTAGLAGVYKLIAQGKRFTIGPDNIFPPEHEQRLTAVWRSTGFESFLLSAHPLDDGFSSNLGLHRRVGRPTFTERERRLVDIVFNGVEWLHMYGTNQTVRPVTLQLSPRERQTLVFVLAGYSHKDIAERMQISQYTVNDYVKSLHKQFSVGSRAELQAMFFVGVPAPPERT